MLEVILTKGLPDSGKSTWAKSLIDKNSNKYKRINKDELRLMLDNNKFSSSNETFILSVRDAIILMAIENGKNVIIDDTNLDPKHEIRIKELIKGKAKLVIKDFTDIPLETCIKQDLSRCNSVGEKVIRSMYKQFIHKNEIYNEDKTLPKAIIVDIDGTLAKMNNRNPFDWSRVIEDSCNEVVKRIVNSYDHTIFIFSGRDSICLPDTVKWLKNNDIKYHYLFMRDIGDTTKDSIVKRKMFEDNIAGKYYIETVFDDRTQVVEMWRSLGLTCFQVAEGDF